MTTATKISSGPSAQVDLRERSALQDLASAYAERLSCIRCAATDDEFAANARLIEHLERRCRVRFRPAVEPTAQPCTTQLRTDPALFLG